MRKRWQIRLGLLAMLGLAFLVGMVFNQLSGVRRANAQEPLAMPPEGQTFVGSKECASCHFDQFLAWRQTKHAKAFDILPAKYRTDGSCLKCHTTGHGEETGYKGPETAALAGASCEACHGPGSEHGKIAKQFANKKLTAEQDKYVRSTIHKLLPGNACIDCHISRGHKKHPAYDK